MAGIFRPHLNVGGFMDCRVLLLAVAVFFAGIDENVFIGILPGVSSSLAVDPSTAGQLTTVFSFAYGITALVVSSLPGQWATKRMLLAAMLAFMASNLIAALSPDFAFLLVSRVLMAACCALIAMQATRFAAELVPPEARGKAIGIIFMGISGSIVLGVPIGIEIERHHGWRAIFVAVTVSGLPLTWALWHRIPKGFAVKMPARPAGWRSSMQQPLLLAQLVSITMIGAHFTLFAYLAPYISSAFGAGGRLLTFAFLCFGTAGVAGAYLGGWCSDRFGRARALLLSPTLYLLSYLGIWLVQQSTAGFLVCLALWGCLSWTVSPVVQAFLLDASPKDAARSVGTNMAAMHFGVAAGGALGGAVLHWFGPGWLPAAGSALAAVASVLAFCATQSAIVREPPGLRERG
ncbi:MFS transporter [Pseudoduganella lutea]|nr:MFS transporter [Pseudoduganella lutea]